VIPSCGETGTLLSQKSYALWQEIPARIFAPAVTPRLRARSLHGRTLATQTGAVPFARTRIAKFRRPGPEEE